MTLWSRSTFQNLESTMSLAKLGKGMSFLVKQAFVGRDETRAPLKSPAWEATTCKQQPKMLNNVWEVVMYAHGWGGGASGFQVTGWG